LNREEAVSLLKKVMAACPSFYTAQAVSLGREKDGWTLSAYWVPHTLDKNCLDNIIVEHGLEVATSGGQIVFRSIQK